ncbi:MAG: serine protease [Pseudomonadota bacterium]
MNFFKPKKGTHVDVAVVKRVRNSICAIGYLMVPMTQHKKDPTKPNFRIVGTGFLVAENLVITCRHVVKKLEELEDHEDIPKDQILLCFVYPQLEKSTDWQWSYIPYGKLISPEAPGVPDLAFITIPKEDKRATDFAQCAPVVFGDLAKVQLGDHIAMWGYPEGEALHLPGLKYEPQIDVVRTGPILQQGYVSAGSPFEVEGAAEYLLDIRTTGGMSGSPVFNPRTGEVIGVHYKGNKLTTSVALAFGLNHIEHWLAELKPVLQATKAS